jgi:hypothetical protein
METNAITAIRLNFINYFVGLLYHLLNEIVIKFNARALNIYYINSIGWLAWHTIRSQDRPNADLFGEEQLWIRDKWYLKFNRKADPKEAGNGHTAAQVAEFRAPDVQTYLDYYRAVFEKTKLYITTRLSTSDLQREVTSPTLGTNVTVESRLLGTINNYQHVGQAGYVKGM